MLYRWLADAVLVAHFGFVVFVIAGGLLALRWPLAALLHLPAAGWGAFVEASGRVCPLTPLENAFRVRAGEAGYVEGFIEHYLLPVIYPGALTRNVQVTLAGVVVLVNLLVYAAVVRRHIGRSRSGAGRS